MKRTLAVFTMLVFVVTACGQDATPSDRGLSGGNAPMWQAISGLTSTSNFFSSGDGGTGFRLINGVPAETRKDYAVGRQTLQQVKSSARPVDRRTIAPASYLKLARLVKLDSAPIEESRVAQILDEGGFHVFDYSTVDNWLYRQALKMGANMRWVWKPMRDADLNTFAGIGISWQQTEVGFFHPKTYAKRIPERVLARAAYLAEKLPDALFLVSDFEVVNPDPFLAVTTPKLLGERKIWIIEIWDEPGFTDKEAGLIEVAVLR